MFIRTAQALLRKLSSYPVCFFGHNYTKSVAKGCQGGGTTAHTATRYYQSGGSDDLVATDLSLRAWQGRPSDGGLTIARSCTCAAR